MDDNQQDLFERGITPWAARIRAGELSFIDTTRHCLDVANANASLDAFECLDTDRALASAAALDTLLANGTDLGPLMGLPIGVKDIMAVEGLPTTNGSNADTAHLTGSEGSVVKTLRASGAVVLGKTRTVEFALGATGVNESRGTPWNPADRDTHRIPGGSSSGSAVATATGMVGMALGTDTGGSVRIPACFTGLVGHKTSTGRWPLDGIFSLSSTLDSVGPLCRTVEDAALMHTLMTGESTHPRRELAGLRFATPATHFLDDLDVEVEDAFHDAVDQLLAAGAVRVHMDFAETGERTTLFPAIVPAELIDTLTPELFEQIRAGVDTVTEQRAQAGLTTSAIDYVHAQRRRQQLIQKARRTFEQVDCWLSPTCPFLPMSVAELGDPAMAERSMLASRNTQPGNIFDFCAISLPLSGQPLPTGLQIMMPWGEDARLLEVASGVEAMLAAAT